ncbi:AMP-dependent synthetase and ligase, partial [Gorgonomyces haynaldii]
VQTGRSLTYEQTNQEINRMAHFLIKNGLEGKCVAVMLENSIEFIVTWFALLKIGSFPAFINYNLKGKALEHVLNLAGTTALVTQRSLLEAAQPFIPGYLDKWNKMVFGALDLSPFPSTEPPAALRKETKLTDPAAYIYTSGTTGFPKAALIPHVRMWIGMNLVPAYAQTTFEDRMYCCLPLYHSSAAMLAFGNCVIRGACLIISTKFSASQFIPDCRQFRATGAIYIGELCRYLLSSTPQPDEQQHQLRFMVGNGLRPDIWLQLKERFAIPTIVEFYASTEGNIALFNPQTDNKYGVGAIGRKGIIADLFVKTAIIKHDPITDEPIRGKDGFCIPCKANEPGEAIGLVVDGDPTKNFSGYKGNEAATKKKLLFDVFVKGDKWFRSGDILKYDEDKYYYFMDRIGDTFRWKGENVSTTEVAEAMSSYPGIEEANVYGVLVPGADGRAGMAALTVKPGFDISGLAKHCISRLPSYAVPLFIRILPEMQTTGTMKQIKHELRTQGCDPSKTQDPIYSLEKDLYVPF